MQSGCGLVASPKGGLTAYVDLYTIRRKGDLVKIWELWDYKTIKTMAGNSFLSIKAQRQYDCAEERYQRLTFTEFSGNMGSGTAILATPTNKNGNQSRQIVLIKLSGKLHATRSDRAAPLYFVTFLLYTCQHLPNYSPSGISPTLGSKYRRNFDTLHFETSLTTEIIIFSFIRK